MRGFMVFAGNISLRAALAVSASGLLATSLLFAFNTLSILAAIGGITLIAVLGARLAAIAIDRALRRIGAKPNGERP